MQRICDFYNFQHAGMSQQIDKRIVLKIHQMVGEGVKQVREMQRHIRIFVKMKLFRNQELPLTTSWRYFPKMSDLRNDMYRASIKLKFSKLDQKNLEEKVKEWRQQCPSDMFFFRGYEEVVDEDNMGSVNGMESDIEVLLDE